MPSVAEIDTDPAAESESRGVKRFTARKKKRQGKARYGGVVLIPAGDILRRYVNR